MNEWLAVLLLGVVEGITEFLPISSTGHLLLVDQWLHHHESDAFLVIIQGGAALAVLAAFQARVKQLWAGLGQAGSEARTYLSQLLAAFVITGIGGLILEKMHFKLPETATPIGIALLAGGIAFLLVERYIAGRRLSDRVTWAIALAIGVGQLVAAVFPGTSRSGVTIVIALLMGLSRPAAVEFTFLLGVPTLLAATALKLFELIHHHGNAPGAEATNWGPLVVCVIISAVVAFISVRWLLRYIQTHTFKAFGWYRIAIGAAVLLPLILG